MPFKKHTFIDLFAGCGGLPKTFYRDNSYESGLLDVGHL